MQIDEIKIDSTIIKFFDDYILESEIENIKNELDLIILDAISKERR